MTNLKQTSFVVRRLLKNEPRAMNILLEKIMQMIQLAICRWAKKKGTSPLEMVDISTPKGKLSH